MEAGTWFLVTHPHPVSWLPAPKEAKRQLRGSACQPGGALVREDEGEKVRSMSLSVPPRT